MSDSSNGERPKSFVAKQADLYRGVAGAGTLGLEIALSIGVGLVGGRWLDTRWGTTPWMSLLGLGVGLIVAIKAVVRVMKLLRENAAREEREQGNPAPLYESSSERAARRERDEAGDQDPVVERLPFDPPTSAGTPRTPSDEKKP